MTYRPFLIFRGRWQRDMKRSAQDPGSNTAKRPTEIPAWLNEACANVLNCASATIHHLCGAACVNELVKVCCICDACVCFPQCLTYGRNSGTTDSSSVVLRLPSFTTSCMTRVSLLRIFHGYMLVSGIFPRCAREIRLKVPYPLCRLC